MEPDREGAPGCALRPRHYAPPGRRVARRPGAPADPRLCATEGPEEEEEAPTRVLPLTRTVGPAADRGQQTRRQLGRDHRARRQVVAGRDCVDGRFFGQDVREEVQRLTLEEQDRLSEDDYVAVLEELRGRTVMRVGLVEAMSRITSGKKKGLETATRMEIQRRDRCGT
ncbi:hypothetical protein HYH03_014079 [Edaphochlamys debaryana]|uniref:Uncharacterized protein n=1 Tax=Edaphochlamys debaryana TaxID=47281 RepID=A0A835XS39_9CHLO|nr:hypothetical protein HYH03_014079 [Edaphochlamys debaryana]|eukprot:KAG2487236.1 hypothetical protein HYH03_014079 [Edaphochlamys debaryana]